MAFESIPGIEGKVFIPDKDPGERKHPCPDCYTCQQCGDDRCRVCRSDRPAPKAAAGSAADIDLPG
jgi:hypothetical protein